MRGNFIYIGLLIILFASAFGCKKDAAPGVPPAPPPVTPTGNQLSYGDSVYYINSQAADYIISPRQTQSGEYLSWPQGIDIDSKTGDININKSETGLRYQITFVPDGTTDSVSTMIVISGINFLDGFYRLNTADSVIRPIYNGNANEAIPGVNDGSVFDVGSGCNKAGCNVNTSLGSINLAQTVRNGVFGVIPNNNDRQQFQLNYRINDKSGETLNTLQIKIYYFDSLGAVSQEAFDIINSRQGAIFGFEQPAQPYERFIGVNSIQQINSGQRTVPQPRPPCIFVLGR
jgi:hypothetical protein